MSEVLMFIALWCGYPVPSGHRSTQEVQTCRDKMFACLGPDVRSFHVKYSENALKCAKETKL